MAELEKIPELIVDPSATEQTQSVLEDFGQFAFSNPKLTLEGLAMIINHPEATDTIMKFWQEGQEAGMRALATIQTVWRDKADLDMTFDTETEAAIENSAVTKNMLEHRTAETPDKMRRERISMWLFRIIWAKSLQEKAEAEQAA